MAICRQKGTAYFLCWKCQYAATFILRPEELNVEVERRIGGKWWTMKLLGKSNSNIDHLSGKGYAVHEYIHIATDESLFVRNWKVSWKRWFKLILYLPKL
jgi:hypothetical protein